jgi:hypothetical protein
MGSEKATARQTYLRRKGKRLKDLKIGSWNVLSPYRPRALKMLKMRWGDSKDHDIRVLGERNWRNVVLNREEWRKLLKKVRTHAGLSRQ